MNEDELKSLKESLKKLRANDPQTYSSLFQENQDTDKRPLQAVNLVSNPTVTPNVLNINSKITQLNEQPATAAQARTPLQSIANLITSNLLQACGQVTPQNQTATVQTPQVQLLNKSALFNRLMGLNLKPKFSDYLSWVESSSADGNISKDEWREAQTRFGWSKNMRKALQKDLDGRGSGAALRNLHNGLQRNAYILNNKLYVEGQEGYDQSIFDSEDTKYKGTDLNALQELYNKDVDDRRKNAVITYDPAKNAYFAKGVGINPDELIDVTNSSWFKDNEERKRLAQLTAYRSAVDELNDVDLDKQYSSKWGINTLANTLGIDHKDLMGYDKLSDEEKAEFREKLASALKQKLDEMRVNADGTFNFDGNVLADRITKYLISQQKKNPKAYSYLDTVSFAPNGRYASASRNHAVQGSWSLLQKNGGILDKVKAFKDGGKVKSAGWGDVLDFVPIVGTVKQGYEMATTDRPLDWKDWGSLGLSAAGDVLMFTGVGAGAGAALKGAVGAAKVGVKSANAVRKANKALKAYKKLQAAGKSLGKIKPGALATPELLKLLDAYDKAKASLDLAVKYRKGLKGNLLAIKNGLKPGIPSLRNPFTKKNILSARNFMGLATRANGAVIHQSNRDQWNEYLAQQENGYSDAYYPDNYLGSYGQPTSDTPTEQPLQVNLEYTPYFSDQILIGGHKNGGTLNMNKINYFQEGGQVAPSQVNTQKLQGSLEDIQNLIIKLVQAAMQGDEKATQTINQIMQAAEKGDQQATQIAQMIQEVAKQMQTPAAKYGAKLSYIHLLRTGCPEGYTISYNKKGGRICKECVATKKMKTGDKQKKMLKPGAC